MATYEVPLIQSRITLRILVDGVPVTGELECMLAGRADGYPDYPGDGTWSVWSSSGATHLVMHVPPQFKNSIITLQARVAGPGGAVSSSTIAIMGAKR